MHGSIHPYLCKCIFYYTRIHMFLWEDTSSIIWIHNVVSKLFTYICTCSDMNACCTHTQTTRYTACLCLQEICHNYMRVLLIYQDHVFACGTNAFSPRCTRREVSNSFLLLWRNIKDIVRSCDTVCAPDMLNPFVFQIEYLLFISSTDPPVCRTFSSFLRLRCDKTSCIFIG